MRFSVVETGYDQRQVDTCLDELGVGLARLAARAERAGGAGREWDEIRDEIARLRALVDTRRPGHPDAVAARRGAAAVEREAAEILARARTELDAAREEARQMRERVYAEAVQARRDFEAALYARRRREERVDEILSGISVEPVAADTPTAAAAVPSNGVPATRAAAVGAEPEPPQPTERGSTRVR